MTPPETLSAAHDLEHFDCGFPELNRWLNKHALQNQISGASQTFVVCQEEKRVIGYYCISSGAVAVKEVSGRLRRNMPDPVPVVVMGRLAVNRSAQGLGLGRVLLRDALSRCCHAAEIIGVRTVHDTCAKP